MRDKIKALKSEYSEPIYKHYFPAWTGNGKNIPCFNHDDSNPSLSIFQKAGEYRHHCHGCGVSGDCLDLIGSLENIPDAGHRIGRLKEIAGISEGKKKIVKIYDYTDAEGRLLFQVVRYEPKGFAQRRPDPNDPSKFIYNLQDVQLVPYNLPAVIKSPYVFIAEGEKDCETLKALGFVASCNAQGATKWRPEYNEHFKGKRVYILPDNDKPGRDHASQVAKNLKDIAESIKVIYLPGLKEKGDISDWIAARQAEGKTAEGIKAEIRAIVKNAPEWAEPEAKTPENKPCKMPLTKLSDLFKEPEEDVNWLLQGILPTGGFSVLASKPKTGKSTFARQHAYCTATGEDFLGLPVKQGPVIYLSLEEKRSEVKKHFRDMGATGEEPIFIFSGSVPADAIEQIRKATEEIKPALIIIDPLFRLAKVRDGNDYVQVTATLEPLLMLARDTGAHVFCVHHTGKGDRQGGDSILGSTAIFSTVDTLLIMKRLEHYRTLQTIQRYGNDLEETTLNFNKETRVNSLGQSKEAEEINIHKKTIQEFLASQSEPLPEAEIKVEGRTGIVRKALRQLVEEDIVKREGKGGKGDPFKYSCFVVPNYIWEQGNKNAENGKEWLNHANYSCSRTSEENQKTEKSREQAFLPKTEDFDRCSYCILTPGQRTLCEVKKPCPKGAA